MSECSFHSRHLQPVRGVRSGRRRASLNLAVMMLVIGCPPHYGGVQIAANAAAELKGLEAAEAQITSTSPKFLVGSRELWKFRLTNAPMGAR